VLARRTAIAHSRLLLVTVAGLAVVTIPLALVESGLLLGPLALLAGAAVAPALASGMALMERALPTRLTEGRSVLNRALAVGLAVGLLLSGWLLEEATPSTAYLVTTGSAFAALAIVLAVRGSLVSVDDEVSSPHEPQLQPST
jgi:MFS family permease